jgi:hypothetical protein
MFAGKRIRGCISVRRDQSLRLHCQNQPDVAGSGNICYVSKDPVWELCKDFNVKAVVHVQHIPLFLNGLSKLIVVTLFENSKIKIWKQQ